MTQRRLLDAHLVTRAVEAGVEFSDGARVSDIRLDEDGVSMRVGAVRLRARALVAADGVNGTTTRAVRLGGGLGHAVALEGNLAYEHIHERFRNRLMLELGVVPGGYGWVFPKHDHVNVGVGGWATEAPLLREHLGRLCSENGIDVARVEGLRGYRLPFRSPTTVLARGRALAVGDAAGLVDPLSGDGIYEAAVSGRLAAKAILEDRAGSTAALSAYPAAVERELGTLASAAWAAKWVLERFPRSSFALMRSRLLWPAVEQYVSGETTDPLRTSRHSQMAFATLRILARYATPWAPV
jgi:flavin-dependent dehydrogenase